MHHHLTLKLPLMDRSTFTVRTAFAYLFLVGLAALLIQPKCHALGPMMAGSKKGLIASAEMHTCALTKSSDAGVRCWGHNSHGQLGDGTTEDRPLPGDVVGLTSGVSAVGVGFRFSCALLTNGGVKCWGENGNGQLGFGEMVVGSPVPVTVKDANTGLALTGAIALSVGQEHACVVVESGYAKCWGLNNKGQLGDGTLFSKNMAVDVATPVSTVSTIDAGALHTCLITTAPKEVYCFGSNADSQLGDGTAVDSAFPIEVFGDLDAIEVSAGEKHSCARLATGGLTCWGDNAEGSLGNGSTFGTGFPDAVLVIGTDGERIIAGNSHSCATRASDGEVLCWGRGAEGQIGDGTFLQRTSPTVTDPSLKAALDVSASGNHVCAWISQCRARCWGSNTLGQLGDGTTNSSSRPVSIEVCPFSEPTPTPTATPTPTPEACASETSCTPDARLTTPLDPRPPFISVSASTSKKPVRVTLGTVKLGVPTGLAQRETLRRRLSTFLKYKIKNLAPAIRSLQVWYILSIVKGPRIASDDPLSTLALPTKYRTETRSRRVSTRLGPGTYVARVTVRVKDSRGRTFSTGRRSEQTTFTVR